MLDLVRLPVGLAATSSDGRLSLFDPERLRTGPVASRRTGHGSVRALAVAAHSASVVATAGDDGAVALWDLREAGTEPVGRFQCQSLWSGCDTEGE